MSAAALKLRGGNLYRQLVADSPIMYRADDRACLIKVHVIRDRKDAYE